ncbi:MAG: Pesticidal crystal protein cry11Bb [Tenericutes bacterium ADurb.Bin239]|nr:MAG: Pesticidal crystal protein cry11Bb [Tenericutes bacterium ADurb.Bin239]
MFSKLLLVLGVAFACGSNLMLDSNNKVSHTPNYSYRYDFIDYESPTYRLGDYDITKLEHIGVGSGQARYNRIQAIIPRSVFDTLAEFDNVYIAIPLYDYNSAVGLYMRIDYWSDGEFLDPVLSDLELIPLSMSMLKSFPYTMVDIASDFNVFDRLHWDPDYADEIRLSFVVPFTPYTQPPGGWMNDMKDITLFTQRAEGYAGGYDDGYYDGYYDGFNSGVDEGYVGGYDDGYYDGFNSGVDEGYVGGYTDGLQDGFENGYQVGFSDAETVGDGTWLGNLVFGTIGGVVGFLFALSDFEVLGVSIMSIITLFVAVGIVKLLLKVLK